MTIETRQDESHKHTDPLVLRISPINACNTELYGKRTALN